MPTYHIKPTHRSGGAEHKFDGCQSLATYSSAPSTHKHISSPIMAI